MPLVFQFGGYRPRDKCSPGRGLGLNNGVQRHTIVVPGLPLFIEHNSMRIDCRATPNNQALQRSRYRNFNERIRTRRSTRL